MVDQFNALHNANDHQFYNQVMDLFGEISSAAGYIGRVNKLKNLKSNCTDFQGDHEYAH